MKIVLLHPISHGVGKGGGRVWPWDLSDRRPERRGTYIAEDLAEQFPRAERFRRRGESPPNISRPEPAKGKAERLEREKEPKEKREKEK